MRNNETGEFELVVGDRQLLSAFFLVVLLCAGAFLMGYVVGQNGPRSGKAAAETAPSTPLSTSAADARPQPLPPASIPVADKPADPVTPPADSTPQPTTQPSQEPQPPARTAQSAPSSTGGLVSPEELPAGNFWQVIAGSPNTAEVMGKTLRDHNFPVILSPAPKGLVRVLVGPYPDTQALGKAKTELEGVGMRAVRYKP
jgi:hypothetical protein